MSEKSLPDVMLRSAKKTEEISNRMDKIDKAIEVRVMDYFKDKEEKDKKNWIL